MLHQQIRSTDLREKSYVYDTRGWDGGLCLIEWMDAWMDGWSYFKGEWENGEKKKDEKNEKRFECGGRGVFDE